MPAQRRLFPEPNIDPLRAYMPCPGNAIPVTQASSEQCLNSVAFVRYVIELNETSIIDVNVDIGEAEFAAWLLFCIAWVLYILYPVCLAWGTIIMPVSLHGKYHLVCSLQTMKHEK